MWYSLKGQRKGCARWDMKDENELARMSRGGKKYPRSLVGGIKCLKNLPKASGTEV